MFGPTSKKHCTLPGKPLHLNTILPDPHMDFLTALEYKKPCTWIQGLHLDTENTALEYKKPCTWIQKTLHLNTRNPAPEYKIIDRIHLKTGSDNHPDGKLR